MGIAKLYGQKKKVQKESFNINGIVSDYYAYAGENISAGDFVEFVNGVANKISYGTSSATKLSDAVQSGFTISACKLTEDKVFVAHGNSDNLLYGIVCNISNSIINVGADTIIINGNNAGEWISVVALSETKVFIAHSYDSTYEYLYGIICTINGTTITYGTDKQICNARNAGTVLSTQLLPSGNVFIAHANSTSYYLYGIVCTISGTTIQTIGTNTQLDSGKTTSGAGNSTCLMPNGNVFIAFSGNTSYALYAIICTINGTTISKGSSISISSVENVARSTTTQLLLNGNVFIAHSYTNSYYLYGVVCSVSGTTISAGTDTALIASSTQANKLSSVLLDSGDVLVVHYSSSKLGGLICMIDNKTITTSVDTIMNSYNGATNDSLVVGGNIFVAFHSDSATNSLSAQMFDIDEVNNIPTNYLSDSIYEPQVRKLTTPNIYGVAKTSGEGGITELPTNLVVNGDFSNGLNGWTNSHPTYCTMEVVNDNGENALKVTINSTVTTAIISQTLSSINTTNIYYFCGWTKGVSSNISAWGSNYISLCGSSSTIPSVDETNPEYTFTSQRSTVSNTSDNVWQKLLLYNRGENAVGNIYYWKDIRCYDLTAIYGAGNEPTKEWCDANLTKEVGHKDMISIYTSDLNLLINGDFSDDFNSWSTTAHTTYYSSYGVKTEEQGSYFEMVTNTADAYAHALILNNNFRTTVPKGNIIYCCAYFRSNNSSGSKGELYTMGNYLTGTNNNYWTFASMVGTNSTGTNSVLFGKTTTETANVGDTYQVRDIKICDLTAMFGAGNEPSKEWCDENIIRLTHNGNYEKYNLIVNGNFNNGLDSWLDLNGGRVIYDMPIIDGNTCLRATAVGTDRNLSTSCRQVVTISSSEKEHIYYASVEVKGKSDNEPISTLGMRFYTTSFTNTTVSSPTIPINTDTWQKLSLHGQLASKPNDAAGDYVGVWLCGATGTDGNGVGNEYYFRNVVLYDLTLLFGEGNEPTKEWCDENLISTINTPIEPEQPSQPENSYDRYNLVVNGDFSDGLNGWTNKNPDYGIVQIIRDGDDKCMRVRTTKSYSYYVDVAYTATIPYGHIWYASAYAKHNNSITLEEGQGTSYFGVQALTTKSDGSNYSAETIVNLLRENTSQEWIFGSAHSGRYSAYDVGYVGVYRIQIRVASYVVGNEVLMKNVKLYDLTEMFGTGNEPDKTWCDNNL